MQKHNAENERVKRRYFTYLKEAGRNGEASVDAAAKALDRFETHFGHRSFKVFHYEQAVAFKRHLAQQKSQKTGDTLSKATLHSTLTHLKRFFHWLAGQPGFKSRFTYSDSEYFNLLEKETRIATARRSQLAPTIEQITHAVNAMPVDTVIERRDRAVIAFTLLTGARDSASASMKLKHFDANAGCVYQDARTVKTKFSKTFTTWFFPVGDAVRGIVIDWVAELREDHLFGNEDPIFPATNVVIGQEKRFEASGITRKHWSTAEPIRAAFRKAFARVALPYFNPHSIRNTLVTLGEQVCHSAEEFKAWSQNLGHEGVMTTFLSYGNVGGARQAQIMRDFVAPATRATHAEEIANAVVLAMQKMETR